MKKIFCIFLISGFLSSFGQETSTVIHEVEIQWPDTFIQSFGWFGDEEGIWIDHPASFAAFEELAGQQWEERIYHYQPMEGYTGQDTSILISHTGSDGSSGPAFIDTTVFIFNADIGNAVHQPVVPFPGCELVKDYLRCSSAVTVQIFDSTGKIVLAGSGDLYLGNLTGGIYFVVIETNTGSKLFKIVR